MNITGKRAIVFGGTSGIGRATCLALTARGAEVNAVSRNPHCKADRLPPEVARHKWACRKSV
jgi:NAD(P)-dependent dehydrogenase (short-subunit alcohol dehydrogenase family)